jgi:pimeloyl-ACP methyl ester carboxylesterase
MMMNRRTLLAAAGLLLPLPLWAQTPPGPFRFKGPGGAEVDAEWGGFDVPEDRRDPASRRIRLNYVRFRSTAVRPGYPLVYLAGGPGGPGTGTARGARFPIFQALREVGDVIAFDQRGTGASGHIPSRRPTPGLVPVFTRDGLTAHIRAEFQRAWSDWTAAGVAMRGYNTVESADDLEDLRRHLGADKIHLWGISYGSHLALAALKRHGARIGKVALASLEGLDQTVKRPARIDGYFEQVDRLLASDRAARAMVPDLPALMRRVHARLESDPVAAPVPLAPGAAPTTLRIGGFALQMIAGGLIKNPDTLIHLPALYRALDAGKMEALNPLLPLAAAAREVSGMPEAMDLASGISPGKLAMVEREAKDAITGDALNFPMPHLLGAVPGIDLGEDFRAAFAIDNPALLIHGSLDGRTPLAEQAEVAAQFRDRRELLVENAGHDVLEAHPGVQDALLRFFKGEPVGATKLSLPVPKFRLD